MTLIVCVLCVCVLLFLFFYFYCLHLLRIDVFIELERNKHCTETNVGVTAANTWAPRTRGVVRERRRRRLINNGRIQIQSITRSRLSIVESMMNTSWP